MSMHKYLFFVGWLLGSATSTVASASSLLGTYSSGGQYGFGVVVPTIDVQLSDGSVTLGEALNLPSSSATQQFSFKSNADDPDFAAFVGKLSNGNNDSLIAAQVLHGTSLGNVYNGTESAGFGRAPDFAGYSIDEIRLTVDPFLLTIVPPNAGLPSGLTTLSNPSFTGPATFRWEVYGNAVPEPCTGLLTICFVGALFICRCRRSQQ